MRLPRWIIILLAAAVVIGVSYGSRVFLARISRQVARSDASKSSVERRKPAKKPPDSSKSVAPAPPADNRLEPLRDELGRYFQRIGGKAGLYLALDDGSNLDINGSSELKSASLIKIPIAIAAYQEAIEGRLGLEETLKVPKITPGFGGQALPPGAEATVDELIELMLAQSDNAAANALIDKIGMDRINEVAASYGARRSVLKRKMLDLEAIEAGIDNIMSPRDMAVLLQSLRKKSILTLSYCDAILSKMSLNRDTEMLAGVGAESVIHKTGVMRSPTGFTLGDAAIVKSGDETFVLAIITEGQPDEKTGVEHIKALARIIIDTFSKNAGGEWKVSIDPGHQSKEDLGQEPIGPGAAETKPKASGGATGVATGVREYEFTLALSNKIAGLLKKEGVRVLMTRTSNEVNISNGRRAELANDFKSDLFIRIHADSNTDPSINGISVLRPDKNRWTKPIYDRSSKAAEIVYSALIRETGAQGRGISRRGDLSGFNWSKVPSILVEAGFLSNPDEDKRLNSDEYQDRLAKAIASGVMEYLKTSGR